VLGKGRGCHFVSFAIKTKHLLAITFYKEVNVCELCTGSGRDGSLKRNNIKWENNIKMSIKYW
jgi:hypothetical protein